MLSYNNLIIINAISTLITHKNSTPLLLQHPLCVNVTNCIFVCPITQIYHDFNAFLLNSVENKCSVTNQENKRVVLQQWFSPRGNFGTIWRHFCYDWGGEATDIQQAENILQCTGQPPPQGMVQPQVSVLPRSRNLGLCKLTWISLNDIE